MTLQHAAIQYLVYLHSLPLSPKRLTSYQSALSDILDFYGPATALDAFTNDCVLDYIRENDPFAGDPVKVERGTVFCKFTHWLMVNHLIPAWADEMRMEEKQLAHPLFDPATVRRSMS